MRIQDKNSKSGKRNNIHACAESGDLNGVRRLLKNNPSLLNDRSTLMLQTPLHVSAGNDKIEIVEYLLDWTGSGTLELEAKNVYGETPLHLAAKNGCREVAKMLLNHEADIEARTNNSMTPLHLAVGYALRSGDNSIVDVLMDYNADTSATDSEGMIALNYLPQGLANRELYELLGHEIEESSYESGLYSCSSNGQEEYGGSSKYGNDIEGKIKEFEDELSKIVGLHELKTQLRKWAKGLVMDEKRRAMGVNLGPRKQPHMAFLGNPGTGKTTVARILGKLLNAVGVLSSDNVTEVQRSDLVADYTGQTATKTRRKIDEATGGVLFVDEAYRLAVKQGIGDSQDFGVEALEEIMSVLEDGELVVIFAGYTEPMKRVFSTNEGFCRRVTHFFQFDDFTCKDLAEMLMVKMKKQNEKSRLYGFKLHPSCNMDVVQALIEKNSTEKLRNRMNGGLVDHVLNNARENLDSRLNFESRGDELLTITLVDLEAGLKQLAQRVKVEE